MKHNNYLMSIGVIRFRLLHELIECLKKHNGSYEWKPEDAPIVCINNPDFFGTIYVEKIYLDYMGKDKEIHIKGTYCDCESEQDEFNVFDVLPCCLSMIMDAMPEPEELLEKQKAECAACAIFMNSYKECMNADNNKEDAITKMKEIIDFLKPL